MGEQARKRKREQPVSLESFSYLILPASSLHRPRLYIFMTPNDAQIPYAQSTSSSLSFCTATAHPQLQLLLKNGK